MSDREKAMDLIRDEMAKTHDNPAICLLGEYLTQRLQGAPEIAGTLLKTKTPLKDGFEAIRDHARKIAKGGYACVDDKTGFGIACKKWGIPEGDPFARFAGTSPNRGGKEAQALAPACPSAAGAGASPDKQGVDALDLDALLELGV